MMKEGSTVRVVSLELEPYVNTSKLFKVISNKPYKDYDGWVEIANEQESIITREKLLEVVSEN